MRKSFLYFITTIGLAACIYGCSSGNKAEEGGTYVFDKFPLTMELVSGDTLDNKFDDIYVLGSCNVIDEGYLFSRYNSDTMVMFYNPDTEQLSGAFRKGNGPNELTATSSYGQPYDSNGTFLVDDYNRMKLYTTSVASGFELKELMSFKSGEYSRYMTLRPTLLPDGSVVSITSLKEYGLLAYNPATDEVTKWPIGYEFKDLEAPEYNSVAGRTKVYNKEKGILAETYVRWPVVIFHDETGEVKSVYEYKTDEQDTGLAVFALTDKHIWLNPVYPYDSENEQSHIFVLNYDGKTVADLVIPRRSGIYLDKARRKLITTDPNNDEANVVFYDIPDAIKEI